MRAFPAENVKIIYYTKLKTPCHHISHDHGHDIGHNDHGCPGRPDDHIGPNFDKNSL